MGLLDWGERVRGWGRRTADLSIQDLRFTVLDTELTGLDPRRDDIIAIGALHMQGARIELGGAFEELVKPSATLDGRTVVIHGITPSQLEARPAIGEVLTALQIYAEDTVLVGHCLSLDLTFLDRDARRSGRLPFTHPAVDTLALYGWLRRRGLEHPAFALELPAPSLYDLADAFEIPVETSHSALGDAYLTAQLLQRFLPWLQQAGVERLRGLRRVGNPRHPLAHLAPQDSQAHF